jgi:hypothetical protein
VRSSLGTILSSTAPAEGDGGCFVVGRRDRVAAIFITKRASRTYRSRWVLRGRVNFRPFAACSEVNSHEFIARVDSAVGCGMDQLVSGVRLIHRRPGTSVAFLECPSCFDETRNASRRAIQVTQVNCPGRRSLTKALPQLTGEITEGSLHRGSKSPPPEVSLHPSKLISSHVRPQCWSCRIRID